MTLRKITFDNSKKYSSPSDKSYDHKTKTVSNPGKQKRKFSQNNRKFIKDITESGFRKIK